MKTRERKRRASALSISIEFERGCQGEWQENRRPEKKAVAARQLLLREDSSVVRDLATL